MRKSFKEFLYEGGFPFLNVYNDEMVTLFGHKEKDFVSDEDTKNRIKKMSKTDINKKRRDNKTVSYMRYMKLVND